MQTRRTLLSGAGCLGAFGILLAPLTGHAIGLEKLIRRKGVYRTQPSDILAAKGGAFWLALADLPVDFSLQAQLGQRLERIFTDKMGGAYRNTRAQRALEAFAYPIFSLATQKVFQHDIVLIDDDRPLVWSGIGGKLGVHKGLLRYVADGDELAAAICHHFAHAELAHMAQHVATKVFYEQLPLAAVQELDIRLAEKDSAGLLDDLSVDILSEALGPILLDTYSREQEEHAATVARRLLLQLGYGLDAPNQLHRNLQRLHVPEMSVHTQHTGGGDSLSSGPGAGLRDLSAADAFSYLRRVFPYRRTYIPPARQQGAS